MVRSPVQFAPLLLLVASSCLAVGQPARTQWSEELASPWWCATNQVDPQYTTSIDIDHETIDIHILKAGHNLFTIHGHPHTVFAVDGDVLYYARYSLIGYGGTIDAVDLKSNRILWSTKLQAVGPVEHSRYSNEMNLCLDPILENTLTVFGHEGHGDYEEVLDPTTGKQLKHRLLPSHL